MSRRPVVDHTGEAPADALDLEALVKPPPPGRGLYTNRTLNLRATQAIGYDMDYTLIRYRVEEWERSAYEHLRRKLLDRGWPVDGLEFDPERVIRGLIIDKELGNVVKANRFGYVKQAAHGTQFLSFDEQRETYARLVVDLAEDRYVFMNTLFSISEAQMYAQAVELLDARRLPEVLGYADLYERVRGALDEAHMEGQLKAEIIAEPDRFVELDPETPLALLDQREAGKRLLLITNSGWSYTRTMMAYAFDRFLPQDMTWRDLFDLVIVGARKPDFFALDMPAFEIVSEDGLVRPTPAIGGPGLYVGGSARMVEDCLGIDGDDILFVGDHIYSDVHVSKNVRRWRTALVMPELETETAALQAFQDDQRTLTRLMDEKVRLEYAYSQLRLQIQRQEQGYGPRTEADVEALQAQMSELRSQLTALDERIRPLVRKSGRLHNEHWGLLMYAGNDKSHLARQIERHADVYTSRVSNFSFETPFVYLRSPRGTLPHAQQRATDPE